MLLCWLLGGGGDLHEQAHRGGPEDHAADEAGRGGSPDTAGKARAVAVAAAAAVAGAAVVAAVADPMRWPQFTGALQTPPLLCLFCFSFRFVSFRCALVALIRLFLIKRISSTPFFVWWLLAVCAKGVEALSVNIFPENCSGHVVSGLQFYFLYFYFSVSISFQNDGRLALSQLFWASGAENKPPNG